MLGVIDRKYLAQLLNESEIEAIFTRVGLLLESGRFASPNPDWPAVPWPPY
jgi:hypothetical protein